MRLYFIGRTSRRSSCVFAIAAVSADAAIGDELFLLVYLVNFLSVSLQGISLPFGARKLG